MIYVALACLCTGFIFVVSGAHLALGIGLIAVGLFLYLCKEAS